MYEYAHTKKKTAVFRKRLDLETKIKRNVLNRIGIIIQKTKFSKPKSENTC